MTLEKTTSTHLNDDIWNTPEVFETATFKGIKESWGALSETRVMNINLVMSPYVKKITRKAYSLTGILSLIGGLYLTVFSVAKALVGNF